MKKEKLTDFLRRHREEDPVSFHMPGHKGARFFQEQGYSWFFRDGADLDITEIAGADNLFQPEGALRSIMDRYREYYHAREAWALVNGSSCGLISGILAAVPRGGKLIMARNCHKSVYNALTLGQITPIYAYPKIDEEWGVTGPVTVQEVKKRIEQAPDASAVMITSPNYYGIFSDIKEIAELAHGHGMVLLVDEAHGAHLAGFDHLNAREKKASGMPESGGGRPGCGAVQYRAAERQGADYVVMSIHKTLAGFTQSAASLLLSDRIDIEKIEDALQMMESSSPSYLLLSSLEISILIMEEKGDALIRNWKNDLEWFYREAKDIPGLRVMGNEPAGKASDADKTQRKGIRFAMDHTKINLSMVELGISGTDLDAELRKRHIYPEMISGDMVMCLTGIGNRRYDYEKLLASLREIAEMRLKQMEKVSCCIPVLYRTEEAEMNRLLSRSYQLEMTETPKNLQKVHFSEAAGRICGRALIPYPPGVPLICPGEVMDKEILAGLWKMKSHGITVMGMDESGLVTAGEKKREQ